MKNSLKFVMAVGLLAALAACSPTKKENSDSVEDEIQAAVETNEHKDAGTDAVPADHPEGQSTAEAAPPAPEASPAPSDVPPPPATAAAPEPAPVAPQEPVAAAAPAPQAPPASGETESYTVQSGDTLMKIAFETTGDLYQWRAIYEANRDRIQDPNHVPPGTVLKVEKPATPVAVERNGEKYLIKQGDTLGTISAEVYGTKSKWRKLWENNKQLIKDPNRIYAGFYLYYTTSPEDHDGSTAPKPMAEGPASGQESAQAAPAASAAERTVASDPATPAPAAPVPAAAAAPAVK